MCSKRVKVMPGYSISDVTGSAAPSVSLSAALLRVGLSLIGANPAGDLLVNKMIL